MGTCGMVVMGSMVIGVCEDGGGKDVLVIIPKWVVDCRFVC